jgi:large subunit ribosomal protein L9
MNIILLQDIDKVGEKFEVVTVKPGYGRNFLIPQKMAIIANRENLVKLEDHKQRELAKEANLIESYLALKEKVEATRLSIGAKAGTSGKIFGSVTSVQIIQAIKEQIGLEIDRRLIDMTEDVKDLGAYKAEIKFHKKVVATVNFDVVAD